MKYEELLRPPPYTPGERVRQLMEQHGMTQKSLGVATGVSRYSINCIVGGRRIVTAAMAIRFAKVFNTDPMYWLYLQEWSDLHAAWKSKRVHR